MPSRSANRWTKLRHCTRSAPEHGIRWIGAQPPGSDKPRFPAPLACLLLLLAACSDGGPEARLRAALEHMESAIEARRPADFVEFVSTDFVGGEERVDRQSLRGLLAAQMLGSERIEVLMGTPKVVLHGERATVTVEVTVLGGRYLPARGEQLHIVSGWRMQDGEWRCYAAEWKPG